MATYTYTCSTENCKNSTENLQVTQSMNDDALEVCPECGNHTLRRVITLAGNHRIGGMAHGNTSMWNVSNDPGGY